MYGAEAQLSGGGGGLAATTPYQDVYFPQAIAIDSGTSPLVGSAGPLSGGNTAIPFQTLGAQLATGPMAGMGVNGSGTAATTPPSLQQPHWSTLLDFHNSPAPWILLGILLLYGWIHVSVRAGGKGRFVLS